MDLERLHDHFRTFANRVSDAVGRPWAFIAAVSIVVGWAVTGPLFRFSDTWQLVINTGTTIVTFLMVFLIQNTQNRDARAMHLKLDELIFAMKKARNDLIDLEDAPDDELRTLRDEFRHIREDHVRYHSITFESRRCEEPEARPLAAPRARPATSSSGRAAPSGSAPAAGAPPSRPAPPRGPTPGPGA